ncbi:MAG: shikimate dehydrogenase [Bacteroidales bacterium]|nr:shikimate dehydrogenase [Bacteroidales bacterium]
MKQFGLLGYPLSHSFSRGYFAEKFKRENLDARYENFAIASIEQLPQLITENPQLEGLNVTIPYKQAVIPYLDILDPEAEAMGAVNTIRIERSGNQKPRLVGYNSDLIGFRESIRPYVENLRKRSQICFQEKTFEGFTLKALILGTGGASKAVEYGLKQLGVEPLFVSRTPEPGRITYENLGSPYYEEYHIIVNTTPLGMFPNVQTFPPIDYLSIGPKHLLFDAVYNPEKTLFLKKGETQGATIKNGLEMLHLQAEASWKIWND